MSGWSAVRIEFAKDYESLLINLRSVIKEAVSSLKELKDVA
jgi:hypothetical protein